MTTKWTKDQRIKGNAWICCFRSRLWQTEYVYFQQSMSCVACEWCDAKVYVWHVLRQRENQKFTLPTATQSWPHENTFWFYYLCRSMRLSPRPSARVLIMRRLLDFGWVFEVPGGPNLVPGALRVRSSRRGPWGHKSVSLSLASKYSQIIIFTNILINMKLKFLLILR